MRNYKTYWQFINKPSSYIVATFILGMGAVGLLIDDLYVIGWAAPYMWFLFFLLIFLVYFGEKYVKWEELYRGK